MTEGGRGRGREGGRGRGREGGREREREGGGEKIKRGKNVNKSINKKRGGRERETYFTQ